jgi:hypothetical protein
MGFLQQFCLIIKREKGNIDKLVYMLSKPPTPKITAFDTLMYIEPFTHDVYNEEYI